MLFCDASLDVVGSAFQRPLRLIQQRSVSASGLLRIVESFDDCFDEN
jgi:hypothetical protein